MNARPLGVHLLAALAVVTGIVSIAGGMALMGVGVVGFLAPGSGVQGSVLSILGVSDLVLGVTSLVVGFGFWYLKNWAWSLGLATYSLVLVSGVVGYLLGAASLGLAIVTIAVSVLVLYFLFQPKVREVFGRPAQA
jgi:hypothetical protein